MFLVYIFPKDKALAASPGIGMGFGKVKHYSVNGVTTLPDMYIRVVIPYGRKFDNIYTSYQILMILLG